MLKTLMNKLPVPGDEPMQVEEEAGLYGIVAEFKEAEQLLAAAQRAREAGYKRMDGYSPFPVHGLAEAIGFRDNWIPWLVFFGGLGGAAAGYGLQYFVNVIDYPWNVGGRPLHSWPQHIPIAFETTILLAAFAAVFGMLALNGLPRPYHSIFNTRGFEAASQDRFFFCIEAADPLFDRENTRQFLEGLAPESVQEVER
jgi:hypothetical protein